MRLHPLPRVLQGPCWGCREREQWQRWRSHLCACPSRFCLAAFSSCFPLFALVSPISTCFHPLQDCLQGSLSPSSNSSHSFQPLAPWGAQLHFFIWLLCNAQSPAKIRGKGWASSYVSQDAGVRQVTLFPARFSENDDTCCHPSARSRRYQQGWKVPWSGNLNPKKMSVHVPSPAPSFSTHLKGHG